MGYTQSVLQLFHYIDSPMLLNVYIHDLPDTIFKKYGYADDLAVQFTDKYWERINSALTQD